MGTNSHTFVACYNFLLVLAATCSFLTTVHNSLHVNCF